MPPVVTASQHRVETGEVRRAGRFERGAHHIVRRAGRSDVVAQRPLEADEILEHRGDARSPRSEVELSQVDTVDLDRARLRVVQPAQQLGERRLAGAVLSDDRQRRAGGNREVEALEHRRAARVGEREIAKANLTCGCAGGRTSDRMTSAPAGAMAGSRRSTAATGAAAVSSAQLSPPNAIIDVPTAHCANTTNAPSVRAPLAAAAASDQKTTMFAPMTRSMLHTTGRSRSRVAAYWSS